MTPLHEPPIPRQDFAAKLHVITAISNPMRYRSRPALYRDFAQRVAHSGATLWTVEAAFGERPHEATDPANPHHIQLRTHHELWHKENLLNIGLQHLSRQVPDWKYAAWVDADVAFARDDWAAETVHQLQHYDAVQMFAAAHDLAPDLTPFQTHTGFGYSYVHHLPPPQMANPTAERAKVSAYYPDYCAKWHPGYAWAWRREALDAVGGFIDTAALGAADAHMALALIGRAKGSFPAAVTSAYAKPILQWQDRAEKYLRRNIGYVPGLLLHYWHGKKRDRRYAERWKILVDHRFNPDQDLKRDAQGLWQLTDRSPGLRDDIRAYFRARNEDSIDLE